MIMSHCYSELRQVHVGGSTRLIVTHWLACQANTAETHSSNAAEIISNETCIISYNFESNVCLYTADRKTIPATKVTNAYAQGVLVNDELLLADLKEFAQFTRSRHATRNAACKEEQNCL